MFPDWFQEMLDDAREFEESGGLDEWLRDVAENGSPELNDKLNEMGL